MTNVTFADLGLSNRLLRALSAANYQTPTPIQAEAIPVLLDGHDLLGIAQTGTGKTAAFTLPLLHNLEEDQRPAGLRCARALILAPTRELVIQISESIKTYGRNMQVRQAVVMGGVGKRPQIDKLRRGVDVLVATPGRLLDLMNLGHLDLNKTEYLILDEADRMLDMGFIRDVRKIVAKLPEERQTLLFSATMPGDVAKLAREILYEPHRIEIAAKTVAVEKITQQVHHIDAGAKRGRLIELLDEPGFERVIVFTRTKYGADKVVKFLAREKVDAAAIHGNKSQGARQKALDNFRKGRTRVLVATDIASRGIDVDDIVLVPVATGMRMFDRSSLFRILVAVHAYADLDRAAEAVTGLLVERHGEEDVTVLTQDSVVSALSDILDTLTLVLVAIASISLSVAGIGIMNVMLVSVSERTSEVGLLKALGVSPSQIVAAFLTEATLLSLAGALLGVAAGFLGVGVVVGVYPELPASPPLWAVAAALGVAIGVGMVFGVLPARRAARLDPIRALQRR